MSQGENQIFLVIVILYFSRCYDFPRIECITFTNDSLVALQVPVPGMGVLTNLSQLLGQKPTTQSPWALHAVRPKALAAAARLDGGNFERNYLEADAQSREWKP